MKQLLLLLNLLSLLIPLLLLFWHVFEPSIRKRHVIDRLEALKLQILQSVSKVI